MADACGHRDAGAVHTRVICLGLILTPLLLAGCTSQPEPATTVTVTASPAPTALRTGDAGPWDLHAVCAAESEIETLVGWQRAQAQAQAHRLTTAQSRAITQAIAVQNLELNAAGLPTSVTKDVATLVAASGTLERPTIDLTAPAVERAQNDIAKTCQTNGLTIGIIAEGG